MTKSEVTIIHKDGRSTILVHGKELVCVQSVDIKMTPMGVVAIAKLFNPDLDISYLAEIKEVHD